MKAAKLPSIRARLANALLLWSLVGGAGVALAVGYAAQGEVGELLDETLQSSAATLGSALRIANLEGGPAPISSAPTADDENEFAWQVVATDGAVLLRSANAPAAALHKVATAGFSDTAEWRLFGSALGSEGRMLYVAHSVSERAEARAEVALSAALAALSIGLLGHAWLRLRVRQELRPLEQLAVTLEHHDPLDPAQALGAAERLELMPVHAAIDQLGQRLARRVAHERAFTSHAAHALRTPLAGMDAQLAVALRESTPALQLRLQRVRDASKRLQRVVQALLDLFRVGGEVRRSEVDLQALLAHLPIEGIEVALQGCIVLQADADLLAAALANLLDNAQRHGAKRVVVSQPAAGMLRLQDDGPGATPERLRELRRALAEQDYDGHTGLGLMLADLVARAHGGGLGLPEAAQGFVVELSLAAPAADTA